MKIKEGKSFISFVGYETICHFMMRLSPSENDIGVMQHTYMEGIIYNFKL